MHARIFAILGFLVGCGRTAPTVEHPPAPPRPTAAPTAPPAVATATRPPPMLTAPPPPTAERPTFTLHKFLGEVGTERDTYVALPGGGTEAKAVFAYKDRTQTVPLATTYTFGPDGALRSYAAWGWTSRFTQVDDHVTAQDDGSFEIRRNGKPPTRVRPTGVAVAVPGYAPMLGQALMLRAWLQHGRPATMAMLPEGELQIESRGKQTYDRPAGKVTLEHVAIRGLVWGREDAWLDDSGQLVAVVTRDAEFDHHEATLQGFESLLPELMKRTGADGVAWLRAAARGAERAGTGVIALVGGNLIDATGAAAIPDAVVVIEGDRIVAAGPRAKVAVPAGATSIDVAGKSIVPGLWDMHAHVQQVEQSAVYLAAGVTTVRDMGNVLEFVAGVRDAIASGEGLGPRILVDGLIDGAGEAALGTMRIKRREDIAPMIDRLKQLGCVEVKTYSSLDPALIKPIIAYAHGRGMRVVGHVPAGMTTQEAIDAGYDSISHLSQLFDAAQPKGTPRPRSRAEWFARVAALDFTAPAVTKMIRGLVTRRVAIDDTLALFEQLFFTREANLAHEPGIATLPRELEVTLGGATPEDAAAGAKAFAKYLELIRLLHQRGVTLVAGTDIAVPGHSLHRELELYVMAGFTPMAALQAATLVPARVMGLAKELGTIEPGKRADLVVVDGDPLASISALRRTALVVARGRVYDSPALWKLAGFRPAPR